MDDPTRRAIEWDCSRLSIEYAQAVDFGRYDDFANLFTEDAVLNAGGRVQGRDKIRRGLDHRDPNLRSRHVLTNILIDVRDERSASGVTYLSLYRHAGPESLEDGPVELHAPAAVGHYEDEFVRTESGWRFASRVLHMAFMRPDAFPGRG